MTAKLVLLPLPERYALPGKPSSASASVVDCHRQTVFLLAQELDAFATMMNLHLEAAGRFSAPFTAAAAAELTYSSRTYNLLADSCRLLTCGAYGSSLLLLRAAIDCIATRRAVAGGDSAEYAEWHSRGVSREGTATAIDLGRFRASGPMLTDELLGKAYRAVSDLGMTHFGANLMLAAPEADAVRISMSFGEAAFHLGWSELISGWLLDLAAASLRQFQVDDTLLEGKVTDAINSATTALAAHPRCHVEESDGRWIFENYRRNNRGQPRRIILG